MQAIEAMAGAPHPTQFLVVFFEDLSRHAKGIPATVWHDDNKMHLRQLGAGTVAFFGGTFGADFTEPERFTSDFI